MTNQFDLNKFNSLLDSASQLISCDADCQKNKTSEQLKDKYLTAESNLTLAEPLYQIAKKNYYTYVSGQTEYDNMIEKELTKKADLIVTEFKDTYNSEKSKITTQFETYNGLLVNFKNVFELHEKYKKENKQLFKQLKEETNDVLTNERKTYYEDQQNDSLNLYYYYFLIVLYYIVVICFCIFSLIYHSTYDWKMRAFVGLFFIILPLISSWILGKIIQIVYWLIDLLPKNVYK